MKRFIVILCILFSYSAQAQKVEEYEDKFYVQSTLLGIDAGRDFVVGKRFLVQTGIGLGAGYDATSSSLGISFDSSKPIPYLRGGIDWYYNKNKRIEKNRTLANNSGNYVGVHAKYSFGDNDEFTNNFNSILISEIHWGIKRTLGSVMYYKVQLGIDHYSDFDAKGTTVFPALGLFIGATF
ncbi:MAG: hypothetical protein LBE34_13200 [Flavobacteriaceae bacterium]|jgi:hypothetical protein|nr:hypothetical protein [Flavobacteriaceae bacterium]